MVQSPSWEANWLAASQEIPRISRNPKVHYRTHKRPPPVSILGPPNAVHIPTSHLLEIHPNIIHPFTPRPPQWSLCLRLPHQDPIHPLSSPISATCPAHLILGEEYNIPSPYFHSSLPAARCFPWKHSPPPGDTSGGVVYLQIVLSPEQASRMWVFLNKVFYSEGFLAPRLTHKLEGHPSSAVRDCLFNLFLATLLIGGRSSIRNLRTRHAVVTGTHYKEYLSRILVISTRRHMCMYENSRLMLRIIRMFQTKKCSENQNTHRYSIIFPKSRVVFDRVSKSVVSRRGHRW